MSSQWDGSMNWKCVILCSLFIAVNIITPHPTLSSTVISQKADGQRKINLSGRQRMLSQFMAKAACFASVNIRKSYHLNQMGQTHWLFLETLTGLRNGNKMLGLLPERNERVLNGLTIVEDEWKVYGSAVAIWRGGEARNEETLKIIFERNIQTLSKMNSAVNLFEKAYSRSGAVDSGVAVALNISGRQRMLTQKSSKEACLIYKGYKISENRTNLLRTINLFSKSLHDLLHGDSKAGLPAPPVTEIREQLEAVERLWMPFVSKLKSILNEKPPNIQDLIDISEQNEPLLYEMNKAVWLYEKVKL